MKHLIACLDGTWNTADHPVKITNVVKIMRALAPEDAEGHPQVVFYDKGVGTGGPIDRIRGGAFGRGLDDNIKDAYRFLANNYEPGDRIVLFGFSRGAFTARSLAGLLGWQGMIKKTHLELLSEAYRGYRKKDASLRDRLRRYCWDEPVRIRFLGVWDTVGALGIPLTIASAYNRRHYQFHDTSLGEHIEHAFHALAIDEQRAPFSPTLWDAPEDAEIPYARVQQVWFAGVHSDVGGSYAEKGLSDIALTWMIQMAARYARLRFLDEYRQEHIRPDPLAPQHDSLGLYRLLGRYRRVIGGRMPEIPPLARRLKRFNAPRPGRKFVNELIHRSVLERWGQEVEVIGKGKAHRMTYMPENLQAALGHVPIAEYDGAITKPTGA